MDKQTIIKEICNKTANSFNRAGMIYMYKKLYPEIDIHEEDFGYRLANNPYEAIVIGNPIVCPIEEQEYDLAYIYNKSEEYDELIFKNEHIIYNTNYEEFKALTWADLYEYQNNNKGDN